MKAEAGRWSYLDRYEQRYYEDRMQAYDGIMQLADDISAIASRYQLSLEEVQRTKNYAFGDGISQYQFRPDIDMAEAWQRLASGRGTAIDIDRHE